MAVSVRLVAKTQLALARYCRAHGVTKTEALERGIALLLKHEGKRTQHPAFTAYQRLKEQFSQPGRQEFKDGTTRMLKQQLDAKYPG